MDKIKCIVTDDEPHALQLVEKYVKDTPFLELMGAFPNAVDSMAAIENDPEISLAFMDIQMPGLSGMSLAKLLRPEVKIVFTTAFEHYAIEGYKVNAVDYLLKPFSYEEFLTAANKAKNLLQPAATTEELKISDEFIMIKADYKLWQIPLADILYIEGIKDYVKIHRRSNGKPLMPLMGMKAMEARLPQHLFMRVHRSYIVNLNNIEVIERGQILFDKVRITISDNYKERFQAFLKKRFRD